MYLEPNTAKRLHQPIITIEESFHHRKQQSQTTGLSLTEQSKQMTSTSTNTLSTSTPRGTQTIVKTTTPSTTKQDLQAQMTSTSTKIHMDTKNTSSTPGGTQTTAESSKISISIQSPKPNPSKNNLADITNTNTMALPHKTIAVTVIPESKKGAGIPKVVGTVLSAKSTASSSVVPSVCTQKLKGKIKSSTTCAHCNRVYAHSTSLFKHMRKEHSHLQKQQGSIECSKCPQRYKFIQ